MKEEEHIRQIRRVVEGFCPCGCGGKGPTNCLEVLETLESFRATREELAALKRKETDG